MNTGRLPTPNPCLESEDPITQPTIIRRLLGHGLE
jgi:hypothetical protein